MPQGSSRRGEGGGIGSMGADPAMPRNFSRTRLAASLPSVSGDPGEEARQPHPGRRRGDALRFGHVWTRRHIPQR